MAIDVTVTSPFSVKRTAVVPLIAAKKKEVSKRKKYLEICRGAGLLFCPFVIEAYGEPQLILQQGMSGPPHQGSQMVYPQSTVLLVHPKLVDIRDYHSH